MTKRKAVCGSADSAAAAICVAAALASGGCESGTKDLFGRGKLPPDEFAVYTRAPLSLPPNYGQRPTGPNPCRAPGGGAQEPHRPGAGAGRGAQRAARRRPTRRRSGLRASENRGRQCIGGDAGAAAAHGRRVSTHRTSAPRSTARRSRSPSADRSFIDRLMFWQPRPTRPTRGDRRRSGPGIAAYPADAGMGEPVIAGQRRADDQAQQQARSCSKASSTRPRAIPASLRWTRQGEAACRDGLGRSASISPRQSQVTPEG